MSSGAVKRMPLTAGTGTGIGIPAVTCTATAAGIGRPAVACTATAAGTGTSAGAGPPRCACACTRTGSATCTPQCCHCTSTLSEAGTGHAVYGHGRFRGRHSKRGGPSVRPLFPLLPRFSLLPLLLLVSTAQVSATEMQSGGALTTKAGASTAQVGLTESFKGKVTDPSLLHWKPHTEPPLLESAPAEPNSGIPHWKSAPSRRVSLLQQHARLGTAVGAQQGARLGAAVGAQEQGGFPSFGPSCSPIKDPPKGGFRRWSSPTTWGRRDRGVPGVGRLRGANVTIPCGKAVLLDVKDVQVHTLLIAGFLK